jgi:hypothetical protein
MRRAGVVVVVLAAAVSAAPVPKVKRAEADRVRDALPGHWGVAESTFKPNGRWEEGFEFDDQVVSQTIDTGQVEQSHWYYRVATVDGVVCLDIWVTDGIKTVVVAGVVRRTADGELVWRKGAERTVTGELPAPADVTDRPNWDAKPTDGVTEYRLKRRPPE